jgi:hypothetical protein
VTAIPRVHLLEIHDQWWCPGAVRDGITDLIRTALGWFRAYDAVAPLLARALRGTGARRVVDLASGGGGPWPRFLGLLAREGAVPPIMLTDRFPNRPALERIRAVTAGAVDFHPGPVDATAVPPDLAGFRTLFTSLHHFRPDAARAILGDAVRRGEGVAAFEITRRDPFSLVLNLLGVLAVLLAVPFVRPFRWDRLLFTYVIPLLPLAGAFDGCVSCLRTYSPGELRALVADLPQYDWEIGLARHHFLPMWITYLIGTPRLSDGSAGGYD